MKKLLLILITTYCFPQSAWQLVYPTSTARAITVTPNGNIFVACEDIGIIKSTNDGNSWTIQNTGLTQVFGSRFSLESSINGELYYYSFSGNNDRKIFRSTNYAANWTNSSSGLPNFFACTNFVFSPTGQIYFSNFVSIYRSTNSGGTWEQFTQGINTASITGIAVNSSGHLFGTYQSSSNYSFGVCKSFDNGETWTFGQPFYTSDNFMSICINNAGQIYIGTSDGKILRSDNYGLSFNQKLSYYGTNNDVWDIITTNDGMMIAAEEKQVHFSNNNGDDWMEFGTGLNSPPGAYAITSNANGYLFLIAYGGIYRRALNATHVKNESGKIFNYELNQNYPNPFNPTTTIGFGISEKGNVRLSVLNILGEEIRVLLNEEKETGYHSIDFNASDFPSGVYFYQLHAGSFLQTKKMVLLR